MMNQPLTRSGWLWIAFGTLILCSTFTFLGQRLYTRFAGSITTGIVSDTYRVRGSTYTQVSFTTKSGETYEISPPFSFRQYHEGEPVTIVYLESSPQNAIIVRPLWHDLPLLIVIPIVLLIAWWSIRHGWARKVPASPISV